MTTEPSQEIPSFKIVLLGETAVGKSCLISRYVNNQFLSNFVPTMGGVFSTKEITYDELNKKKIKWAERPIFSVKEKVEKNENN